MAGPAAVAGCGCAHCSHCKQEGKPQTALKWQLQQRVQHPWLHTQKTRYGGPVSSTLSFKRFPLMPTCICSRAWFCLALLC